ncbi:hypothetical protein D3C77_505540 [compost metagenome]
MIVIGRLFLAKGNGVELGVHFRCVEEAILVFKIQCLSEKAIQLAFEGVIVNRRPYRQAFVLFHFLLGEADLVGNDSQQVDVLSKGVRDISLPTIYILRNDGSRAFD